MANARSTLKGMPDFVATFMVAPTEVLPMSVVNQQAETRVAAAAAAAAAAVAENVSDVLSTTSSTTVSKVVPAVTVSPTTLSNSDIAASKDSKSAAVFPSVSSVAIDETPAVISNVPLFPAPNFGIVEPACLPDLNVCRHLPTRSLRGVNVFQVDSETGFVPCLGLAPFDTTIMRRFTDMENVKAGTTVLF